MAEQGSAPTECRIVGRIRSQLTERQKTPPQADADLPPARIEINTAYREALSGIRPGAAAQVLTWLHEGDRGVLQCHPRGDSSRPMRGVFATRSPDRPNPIGLHPVRILAIEDLTLTVHPLEALDDTPVLDIKPLISSEEQDPPWGPGIPDELGRILRSAGRDAWHKGLVNGRNGNLSLRQGEERMVITRHGSAMGRLVPGDLVDGDIGSPSGAGQGNISSEGLMHAEIYRRQPRAGAVLHTHPPSLLALSLLRSGRRMLHLPLSEAGALAGEMAVVPAREPGTRDLALAVGRAAEERQAVFIQGHGLVCWGEDVNGALDLTEELEGLARIQLVSCG